MIERLLARYRLGRSDYNAQYLSKFGALNRTQSPIAAMISCSDTRLEPSRLFALDPGDVFSIRNIANLVPRYSTADHPCETAAGLEFAVTKLQVPHVVVLGHSHCNTKPVLGDMEDGWRYTPGLSPKIAPVFGLSCAKTWRAQWLTFTHSSGW